MFYFSVVLVEVSVVILMYAQAKKETKKKDLN